MKISALIPATLAAGILGATMMPVAASAQVRTVTTTRTTTVNRDNYRPRSHTRRVCRMQYRNHHRVRVCRTVRYR